MGSFSIWHWIILLVLGGFGYAIYRIVRPQQLKRTISPASAVNDPIRESTADGSYEIVARELRSNSLKEGLWTKAFAEADGDKAKAQAAYIRYRVVELQAERSSGDASPRPNPQAVLSDSIPRWKKTARGVGMLLTWVLVAAGVFGVLLSAYVEDFQNPQSRRFAGQVDFYAVIGIGILSAVYARRRKPLWFLIGLVGAYVGLLTASTVVGLIRNALA